MQYLAGTRGEDVQISGYRRRSVLPRLFIDCDCFDLKVCPLTYRLD